MHGVELRPLGVGEILDVGIKITWRHAWTFIRTVLIVVAPVQILAAVIQLSAMPDSFFEVAYGTGSTNELEPVDESEFWAAAAAFGIALLLGGIATTLATG